MIILNTKVFHNRQQLLSSNFNNTRSCSWKTFWWRHLLVCVIQLSWGFRSCPESFNVQSFNIILIMSMVSAYRKRWFIQHQNRPNNMALDCSGPGCAGTNCLATAWTCWHMRWRKHRLSFVWLRRDKTCIIALCIRKTFVYYSMWR